jgi:hypothetical protein
VVAVSLLLVAGAVAFRPNPSAAQLDTCRITDARASVFTAFNEAGAVVYYGHALMSTEDCGEGPVTIEATYEPSTGQPQSCSPISSVFIGEAACTYAYGTTIQGAHVLITGTGNATGAGLDGSGGSDSFNSSCTLVVSTLGRSSCPFPLE